MAGGGGLLVIGALAAAFAFLNRREVKPIEEEEAMVGLRIIRPARQFEKITVISSPPLVLNPRLFDRVAIRDTSSVSPLFLIQHTTVGARTIFEIDNGLDAAINLTIVGSFFNNPSAAGDIAGGGTIAASTRENLASDFWAKWIGVRVVAVAAPTSGVLTIDGYTEG